MSLKNQIHDLIEREVSVRIETRLTDHLEFISKKWNISFKILLQDSLTLEDRNKPRGTTRCGGIKADGKRCEFASRDQGYCKFHLKQKKVERSTQVIQTFPTVEHTHSLQECLWKADCPACTQVSPKQKSLIDSTQLV
jgi:hypothetical protein